MLSKRYIYNAQIGQKYAVDGCLSSNYYLNATPMSAITTYSPNTLARAVDLRPFMSDIELQYVPGYGTTMASTNSCTAHSCIGAYEYLLRRLHGNNADMSRLFLYYNARAINPMYRAGMVDSGCAISHAIHCLQKYGTCTEDRWQFHYNNLNQQPPAECYTEAKRYLTTDVIKVDVNETSMKSCLAQGFPIIFSLKLTQSFYQGSNNNGWISEPKPWEATGVGAHALHALLIVGYNDDRQMFVIRNSWGASWGDKGYGFAPYSYIANPAFASDAYAIRQMSTNNMGQDHWLHDPSQMQFSIPTNLGGSEDGEEENWTEQEEPVDTKAEGPTVHPDELVAEAEESEEPTTEESEE